MRPPSLILIFRKESESEVKHEIQNLKFLIKNKDLLFPDVRNRPSDSIRFENAL